MQNTSHAVMAQRQKTAQSLDFFPTPPWATRALIEHVLCEDVSNQSCLEPACGTGDMARPLSEYFKHVESRDIFNYGFGSIEDYTKTNKNEKWDWIITNPPFILAEEFIRISIEKSKNGCAFLVRTTFIESIGRYNRIFSDFPPEIFAQFSERVPMVKGRLDPLASTATGYCWLVWRKRQVQNPILKWIPPCRKRLEKPSDYMRSQLSLL